MIKRKASRYLLVLLVLCTLGGIGWAIAHFLTPKKQDAPIQQTFENQLRPPKSTFLERGLNEKPILTKRASVCEPQKGTCLSCHQQVSPQVVKDWENSAHFRVNPASQSNPQRLPSISCADCHGSNPQQFAATTVKNCQTCHGTPFAQQAASAHGHDGFGVDLAIAHGGMQPKSDCMTCHAMKNNCDVCHSRHRFSVEEAKAPETCKACHAGQDKSQNQYYEVSAHGLLHKIETAQKIPHDERRAPTCVTCHLHQGNHNVSLGLTIGTSGAGRAIAGEPPSGLSLPTISKTDFQQARKWMQARCMECHSSDFAKKELQRADLLKQENDRLAGEVLAQLRPLMPRQSKLASPLSQRGVGGDFQKPESLPLGSVDSLEKLVLFGHEPAVQLPGLYGRFFHAYKFQQVHTWKGAYHSAPSWADSADILFKLELAQLRGDIAYTQRLEKAHTRVKELKDN